MRSNKIISAAALLALLLLFMFPVTLRAEATFLKDGSIVTGKIISETDKETVVKTDAGETKKIVRAQVLRVLFTDDYRAKKFIYKKDCTYIEGFIVGEADQKYILRRELESPDEYFVEMKDVSFFTDEKVVLKKVKEHNYKNWYFEIGIADVIDKGFGEYLGPALEKKWNTFQISAYNSLADKWHYGLFAYSFYPLIYSDTNNRTSYNPDDKGEDGEDDLDKTEVYPVMVTGGYNYRFFERFTIQPYMSVGMVMHFGTGVPRNYNSAIGAGLRLPVRFYRGNCITPFVDYIYTFDSYDQTTGFLRLGLAVSI